MSGKLFSPLEQFITFNLFGCFPLHGVKLTNLALNFIIVISFLLVLFFDYKYKVYITSNKSKILSIFYYFNKNLFKENVNIKAPFFFTFTFFIFLILVSCNLLGLVPFSFTITSSFLITFFVSIAAFIYINFTGFKTHGLKFFNIFLPSGAPLPIVPFLVIIEFISYNARIFSLAIRLFANMMSGHILLKILTTAIYAFIILYFPMAIFPAIMPIIILLIIIFLELCIALLQAYVFVTLLCIYFNEAVNLH